MVSRLRESGGAEQAIQRLAPPADQVGQRVAVERLQGGVEGLFEHTAQATDRLDATVARLRVEATVSGSLAIHTVARLRPKVALIDYNLPDLDGVTVAERIKRLSPGTAMIVMSGRIDGLSDHTLANTGIFTFMNKPVALGPLRSAVLTLIRTTTRTGLPPPLPKKRLLPLSFGSFSLT